jgi:uncharacterized membrane protein
VTVAVATEAPSTKHQAPEKHQAPITKQQLESAKSARLWSLLFGISLVLGAWNLEL